MFIAAIACIRKDCFQNKSKFITEDHKTYEHYNSLIKIKQNYLQKIIKSKWNYLQNILIEMFLRIAS
jgi:hypothetical protein